jgi:hypothetical protein
MYSGGVLSECGYLRGILYSDTPPGSMGMRLLKICKLKEFRSELVAVVLLCEKII